ncbi:MAG: LysM peptidoglycan-binding domain-containing protein [Phycisphaerae bacterium]
MRNSQLVAAVVVVVIGAMGALYFLSRPAERDSVPIDGGRVPPTDVKTAPTGAAKPTTPKTPESARPSAASPPSDSGANAPARRPAAETPPVSNIPRPVDNPRPVMTPPPVTTAPSVVTSIPTYTPSATTLPTATRPTEAGSLPPMASGSGAPGTGSPSGATPGSPARPDSRPAVAGAPPPVTSGTPGATPTRTDPPTRTTATTPPTGTGTPDPGTSRAPERRPDAGGARPTTETPPPVAGAKRSHKIASGDTLAKLAKQYLGDEKRWRKIKDANPGLDENRLTVGQELVIPAEATASANRTTPPAAGTATATRPAKPSEPANKPVAADANKPTDPPRANATTHKVSTGDTLIQIARKMLKDENRWREIFELNRDQLKTADDLRVGMVLKLPPSAKAESKPTAGQPRTSGGNGDRNRPRKP